MPTTYRKKPVEIQVVEYDGSNHDAIVEWLDEHGGTGYVSRDEHGAHLLVYTLEGVMRANPGDFICRGTQGEFYPCKPAAFHASHEAVQA